MVKTIEFFTAFLTPLIAIITTFIAWQQWKTNKQKLNLEKYDRRLRVYGEVVRFINNAALMDASWKDSKTTIDDLMRFRSSVSEADFLFGSEIPSFLDELYKHGINLCKNIEACKEDSDRDKISSAKKEKSQEFIWFSEQPQIAKEKFYNYLKLI